MKEKRRKEYLENFGCATCGKERVYSGQRLHARKLQHFFDERRHRVLKQVDKLAVLSPHFFYERKRNWVREEMVSLREFV